MAEIIVCPKCGTEIEVSNALRTKLETEVAQKFDVQKRAMEQRTEAKFEEQLKTEREKILNEQLEKRKELTAMLEEKCQLLSEANKNELELRRQQQKLEDEKATFELIVQRKLDEERKTIIEQASKRAAEQQQLKLREKDDQLESLTNQIAELKRRAEVGSQQAAGEALETNLEDILRQTFPFDQFEEVKKGQRGADIFQKVYNKTGKFCGSILWEAKNTKDFNNTWISKLRKDQQDAKADVAVIVTIALPKEIEIFGRQDDIWVSNFEAAPGLASVLHQMLVEVARQKIVSTGQASMKDLIYEYVTGTEFAMHIKIVVSAFAIMQEDLEKEKRAIILIWKKREKQISAVLENVANMKGSIEGLAQKALPETEILSLGIITSDET